MTQSAYYCPDWISQIYLMVDSFHHHKAPKKKKTTVYRMVWNIWLHELKLPESKMMTKWNRILFFAMALKSGRMALNEKQKVVRPWLEGSASTLCLPSEVWRGKQPLSGNERRGESFGPHAYKAPHMLAESAQALPSAGLRNKAVPAKEWSAWIHSRREKMENKQTTTQEETPIPSSTIPCFSEWLLYFKTKRIHTPERESDTQIVQNS